MDNSVNQLLATAKRIVVKAGTSTLTHAGGKLNFYSMDKLVRQLADLHNRGCEVVLVSSGAVGCGMGKLNLPAKPTGINEKQALAAIGQSLLMQNYEKFFAEYGITTAQVLLTGEDIFNRERFLNVRNTFHALFRYGVVPVINENDTVAVQEIKVGDNDTLAALVAQVVGADLLVLLTDIDGLYDHDPRTYEGAKKIDVVEQIDEQIIACAGGAGSNLGTGGMQTKIQAAQMATACGIPMALVNGSQPDVLRTLSAGQCPGTLFLPKEHGFVSRKGWLAFGSKVAGKISVDAGAARALCETGSSLLAKGIIGVGGDFLRGDVVRVLAGEKELARGVVNYSSEDIACLMGKKSSDFSKYLTEVNEDEIIHRDNLSLKA